MPVALSRRRTVGTHDVTVPHPAPRAPLSRRERATSPSPSGRGVGVREMLLGKYASLNNSILPFDCVYPGIPVRRGWSRSRRALRGYDEGHVVSARVSFIFEPQGIWLWPIAQAMEIQPELSARGLRASHD